MSEEEIKQLKLERDTAIFVAKERLDEIERIKNQKEIFELRYLKTDKENERLNNIINELEKDLGLELMKTREPNEYNKGLHNAFKYIKNKLQELKGEDKE